MLAVVRLTADGSCPSLGEELQGVADCLVRTVVRASGPVEERHDNLEPGSPWASLPRRTKPEPDGNLAPGRAGSGIFSESVVGGFVGAVFSMPFDCLRPRSRACSPTRWASCRTAAPGLRQEDDVGATAPRGFTPGLARTFRPAPLHHHAVPAGCFLHGTPERQREAEDATSRTRK